MITCYQNHMIKKSRPLHNFSTDSNWHMIVGGSNQYPKSLNSVELFNWQTGEKCRLANLPVPLHAHSGINFLGDPVICGGISNEQIQDKCFRYNKTEQKWDQVSLLK